MTLRCTYSLRIQLMSKMFNLETVNISFTTKMLKFLFHYLYTSTLYKSSIYHCSNQVSIQYAVKIVWNLDIIFEDLDAKLEMFCDFAIKFPILRIFSLETNSKSFLATSCDFLMNVSLRIQLNNALKCSILKLYALIKFVLQWYVCTFFHM